ncbi:lipoprotein [Bordetella ansorpii]|uniref:Lipoprotein n=1 Tax=Bordetella ansorpii TaxID=288768 RepID=A0A157RI08_9BORD|nr:tripartite tricarboxylate transporter substrate binding protein [Bordetella ansorpii]SAI57560.1 lipoprotein [Bordetella ansorpii]
MNSLARRDFLKSMVALAAGATMSAPAWAEGAGFPSKPISVIVPYGPGGLGDYTGRALAMHLSEVWKANAVVENRAGASGIIGSRYVSASRPDGYTILMSSNTTVSAAPMLFKNLPYDPRTDLVEAGVLGIYGSVALVRKDAPYQSIPELVAYGKAHPGELFYAYTNTSSQVPAEMLNAAAGVAMQGVSYKETGRAITDLMSGQVQVFFMDYVAAAPHVAGGKLSALGVTQATRTKLWPSVPAIAEFYPGFEMTGYVTISLPSATPAEIVQKYNQAIRSAVKTASVAEHLESQGLELKDYDVAQTKRFVDDETRKWTTYVQIAKIVPQ